MERLTYREDGETIVPDASMDEVIERLADYEDTGFTPKQTQLLSNARRARRLFLQPCKVGDELYRVVLRRFSSELYDYRYHVQKTSMSNHTALFVLRYYNKWVFRDRSKATEKVNALNRELAIKREELQEAQENGG